MTVFLLFQIQVTNHGCAGNNGPPYCVCGIAARAGRDVFVLNVCDGQSVVDFYLCDDSALKVEKKTDLKFVVRNHIYTCQNF